MLIELTLSSCSYPSGVTEGMLRCLKTIELGPRRITFLVGRGASRSS